MLLSPLLVFVALALLPAPAWLVQHSQYYVAVFAAVITGLIIEPIPAAAVGLVQGDAWDVLRSRMAAWNGCAAWNDTTAVQRGVWQEQVFRLRLFAVEMRLSSVRGASATLISRRDPGMMQQDMIGQDLHRVASVLHSV